MKALNINQTKQLASGLACLADALDAQFFATHMDGMSKKFHADALNHYEGMIRTLTQLGGEYKRDDNGKHTVILAGLFATAENLAD